MVDKLSGNSWIGLRVSSPVRRQTAQSGVFGAITNLLTPLISVLLLIRLYQENASGGDLVSRTPCWIALVIISVIFLTLYVPPRRIKILFKDDIPMMQRIGRTYALVFLWCAGLVAIAVSRALLVHDLYATLRPFFIGWFFGLPVLFAPSLIRILARLPSDSEIRIDLEQRKIYYFVREDLLVSGAASLKEVQGVALKYIDPYWEVWLKLPEYNNIRVLYTLDKALAQEFCTQLKSLIQQAVQST